MAVRDEGGEVATGPTASVGDPRRDEQGRGEALRAFGPRAGMHLGAGDGVVAVGGKGDEHRVLLVTRRLGSLNRSGLARHRAILAHRGGRASSKVPTRVLWLYYAVRSRVDLMALAQRSDPSLLVLVSLAEGPKHGYALTKDIEAFAGISLGPGTLYGCIARLEGRGLIEALPAEDRRNPYRLTAAGATALREELERAAATSALGLRRLEVGPV